MRGFFLVGHALVCVKQIGLFSAGTGCKHFQSSFEDISVTQPISNSFTLPTPLSLDVPQSSRIDQNVSHKKEPSDPERGVWGRLLCQYLQSVLLVTNYQPLPSGQWSKSFVGRIVICYEEYSFFSLAKT